MKYAMLFEITLALDTIGKHHSAANPGIFGIMYKCKSRITAGQQYRLLEHFVAGTTARAGCTP
jgi:hypothetical protein